MAEEPEAATTAWKLEILAEAEVTKAEDITAGDES